MAAAALSVALFPTAALPLSGCDYFVYPYPPGGDTSPGDANSAIDCNFTLGSGAVIFNARARGRMIEQASPPMTPTAPPDQTNYLELDFNAYPLDGTPGSPPDAAVGSNNTQLVYGTHALGASTAPAWIEADVRVRIFFDLASSDSSIGTLSAAFGGFFGSSQGPAGFYDGFLDSDGTKMLPSGFTATPIMVTPGGTSEYVIQGTAVSDSFPVIMGGSPNSISLNSYLEGLLFALPGLGGSYDSRLVADAEQTVTYRIMSSDPNASFSFPAPEPTTTLLIALATLAVLSMARRRDDDSLR